MIPIKPNDLNEALIRVLLTQNVPMIHASPGVGKSQIVKQLADKYSLELIDMRLSQYDATDLNGFPCLEGERSKYKPPATIPLETDEIPKNKNGWLLFLDEINSAFQSVQASAYKLILDRAVGDHKLHPKVYMVAAGNLATDKAIVNRSGTAMQSRLIHFQLEVDKDSWFEWANTNKIDSRVISFIGFRPALLHNFDPNHSDSTFPCPRTWEFLSNAIKNRPELDKVDKAIAAGTVGQGAATEFFSFINVYTKIPTIQQIIDAPTKVKLEDEPSMYYALSGMVASNINDSNITPIYEFIKRLPLEFQTLTWRFSIKRNPQLMSHDIVKDWLRQQAKEM